MDGAILDLTLVLVTTIAIAAAAVAAPAGFAFGRVEAGDCGGNIIRHRNSNTNAKSPRRITLRAATWVTAFAAVLLHGSAGLAQDDAKVRAGLETWRSSGCVDCHGPFANGERDDDDYPMGANLRTTRLDPGGIKLTIMCGRPGTGMPSFDAGAYTARACYGRPLGAAPDDLQPTPRTLSLDQIDALVAYLEARIVGHGKVTRAECRAYFEGKADCDDFK
jgi:mono/diheme cytochrome c family protein